MAGYDYDLFVIGAGSGGVRAARVAAGHGAKVVVAETPVRPKPVARAAAAAGEATKKAPKGSAAKKKTASAKGGSK